MNTLLALILSFEFQLRNWGLNHPVAVTWLFALWAAAFTFIFVLRLVVRPGIAASFTLWRQTVEHDLEGRRFGPWRRVFERRGWNESGLKVRWAGSFSLWPEFYIHPYVRPRVERPVHAEILESWRSPGQYDQSDWQVNDPELQFKLTKVVWAGQRYWSWWMWRVWTFEWAALATLLLYLFIWGYPRLSVVLLSEKPKLIAVATATPPRGLRPSETPEPVVTPPAGAEASVLVIDLDREAPPAEIWEWLEKNLPKGGSIPTIPINWQPPEWLIQLFGQPVTVIRLGANGFVVVTNTELGMEFIRTDEQFNAIGAPVFVMSDEATVTAGEFHWGVSFDTKGNQWRRPVNGYRGNVELVVFNDVYETAFILRGRGVVHNLWVEVPLILVSLAFISLLTYSQGTRRR
ncbi:hypothetical protein HY087_01395 [Candidatus Gottesmanbacteria bacterium]|nr:hypothetical protein [Candidatus Gottesmanbacteria bacterium]